MSSLDKYGVPHPDGKRRIMGQPKPKHRFRVIMYGFGGDDTSDESCLAICYETNSIDLPKFNIATHELHTFDTVSNYGGKMRWGAQTLSVRDTIDNGPLEAIVKQIQRHRDYNKRIAVRTSTANYKFEVWIQTIGGETVPLDTVASVGSILNKVGGVIDSLLGSGGDIEGLPSGLLKGTINTWICTGCVLSDVNFGSMDYSTSDFNSIDVTFKPDNCLCIDSQGNPLSEMPGMLSSKDAFNDAIADFAGGILGGIAGSLIGSLAGGLASSIGGNAFGNVIGNNVNSQLSKKFSKSASTKIGGLL